MNKIEQLQQLVSDIESTVSNTMPKEELYDILVVAYNHLKDIIVLQQDLVPVAEDKVSKAALRDAEDALNVSLANNTLLSEQLANSIAENGRLTDTIDARDNELFKLNAWKDGANLEGEQMRDKSLKDDLIKKVLQQQIDARDTLITHLRNDHVSTVEHIDSALETIESMNAK